MAKLGYTWYPKDWGNSEAVFELTLVERGLYRELIDLAMLNDNKTVINKKVWSRKFGASLTEIETILITLSELNLIEMNDNILFIPSCESRLNLSRGGRNGGKKSKPSVRSKENLNGSLSEASPKASPKPKEKKGKEIKEKENIKETINKKNIDFDSFWKLYPNKVAKEKCKEKFLKLSQKDIDKILKTLKDFVSYKPFEEYRHPNPLTYLNQKRWNDEVEVENKAHVVPSIKYGSYDK